MEQNLNNGKTASECSQEFQESKRELLLIGHQVDKLFLSTDSSPLLPEWNPSERDNIFEPDEVEESEESSESDVEKTEGPRQEEEAIPAGTTQEARRDESDPIGMQLTKLRLRIEEMSLRLKQT
jgi:hypothetical protein